MLRRWRTCQPRRIPPRTPSPSLVSISTLREYKKCRPIIHGDNAETRVTLPRCDTSDNLLFGITEVSSASPRLQMHLAINAMSLDAWDSWFDRSSLRWILKTHWCYVKIMRFFTIFIASIINNSSLLILVVNLILYILHMIYIYIYSDIKSFTIYFSTFAFFYSVSWTLFKCWAT